MRGPAVGSAVCAIADPPPEPVPDEPLDRPNDVAVVAPPAAPRRRLGPWILGAAVILVVTGVTVWQLRRDPSSSVLRNTRYQGLTDFPGNEQAAAISRDGRFVAFRSDRDGRMDVWVTQVGTGKFYNLTQGAETDIANSSLRTLGFTPDGSLVTYWRRVIDSAGTHIGMWAAPVLGGPPRPYLDGVAEADWSADGTRLVSHPRTRQSHVRTRCRAGRGAAHILNVAWAPRAFPRLVAGSGIHLLRSFGGRGRPRTHGHLAYPAWRGSPERITHHDSRVTHPVFLDARTLAYLASDPDGSGPWLHTLDIRRHVQHRVSSGLESYTSLAASADGQRLVATKTNRKSALWRFALEGTRSESTSARRISLTTGSGSAPRLGAGYLLYVSSRGDSDSIWKLQGDVATELWSAPETRIVGAPALARDGWRIAFRPGGSPRRRCESPMWTAPTRES